MTGVVGNVFINVRNWSPTLTATVEWRECRIQLMLAWMN
jgi:hypothetical protein